MALGAGAVGGVEAEAARLELGHVDAAVRAGHGGAEEGFAVAAARSLQPDEDEAVGERECGGDGGLQAAGVVSGLLWKIPIRWA